MSSSSAKRARISNGGGNLHDKVSDEAGLNLFREDDGSPDLFSLYSGDLGNRMFTYASGLDLCNLDALNKQFKELTADRWTKVTYDRFGMRNGKDDWRLGVSFLRKPVFIEIESDPDQGNMYYAGSPHVTAHNSLIAVTTDDEIDDGAPSGINIYDAKTLKYIKTQDTGGGWNVAMAGPEGEEVFVTSYMGRLEYCHAVHDYCEERQIFRSFSGGGIPVITSKKYVISVAGNILSLNRLVPFEEEYSYVVLCQSVRLGRDREADNELPHNSIGWGPDQSTFVVYYYLSDTNINDITVWSLDADTDRITKIQRIAASIELSDVALSEDYIVASCEDKKKIHVWDRTTKEKMPFILCDEKEEDQSDNLIFPVRLSCHGHLLITTSHLGGALCVWNVKTGELLQKCNDAVEGGYFDHFSIFDCVTKSMTYWKHQNGFVCVNGYLSVWSFPTNQEQMDAAIEICNREEAALIRPQSIGGNPSSENS